MVLYTITEELNVEEQRKKKMCVRVFVKLPFLNIQLRGDVCYWPGCIAHFTISLSHSPLLSGIIIETLGVEMGVLM